MLETTEIKKLENYLKGNSNIEEQKYIYTLFSENEGNDKLKRWMKDEFLKHCKRADNVNYELTPLLDKIHHILHGTEIKRKQKTLYRIYRWYAATAAILLIPFFVFGGIRIYNYMHYGSSFTGESVSTTIVAPLGSRIRFSLPDGTIGWLNSGSTLDYSVPFSANRKIKLNGEAWFDVADDEKNPFEITAGKSTVTVLGTKFNLNAYPDEKHMEVALEDGKVSFSMPNLLSDIQMKPNERLVLGDGTINLYKENTAKYGAWREGKLVFRGDSMNEVARRIERWYNVEVVLVDKILEDYIIRGTFQDDSIEEVLKYLSMTSPINYKIIERVEHEDGSIEKKKVLIFAKHIN